MLIKSKYLNIIDFPNWLDSDTACHLARYGFQDDDNQSYVLNIVRKHLSGKSYTHRVQKSNKFIKLRQDVKFFMSSVLSPHFEYIQKKCLNDVNRVFHVSKQLRSGVRYDAMGFDRAWTILLDRFDDSVVRAKLFKYILKSEKIRMSPSAFQVLIETFKDVKHFFTYRFEMLYTCFHNPLSSTCFPKEQLDTAVSIVRVVGIKEVEAFQDDVGQNVLREAMDRVRSYDDDDGDESRERKKRKLKENNDSSQITTTKKVRRAYENLDLSDDGDGTLLESSQCASERVSHW
jgi:hypothetical protein